MIRNLFLMMLAAVLLSSCNGKTIYSQTVSDFKDNRWAKQNTLTFEFDIGQAATQYEAELLFNHIYGYQFENVPIRMAVNGPLGIEAVRNYTFHVLEKGKDVGDCAGDYCDVAQTVQMPVTLLPGHYKVTLQHEFPADYLPNVLGVGIRITQKAD